MSTPNVHIVLMTGTTLQPDGQLDQALKAVFAAALADPRVTPDEILELIAISCRRAAKEAVEAATLTAPEKSIRRDELERIQAVTLDADTDVWSLDDRGNIIPLTERLRQLQ